MTRKQEIEEKYSRKKLTDLTVGDISEIMEYIHCIMVDMESTIITKELFDSEFGE